MLQRQTNVVQTIQESVLREVVHRELDFDADLRHRKRPVLDVDRHLQTRFLGRGLEQEIGDLLIDLDRDKPGLGRVVAEDIAESRGDDRLKAIIHQRPDSMLAGRPGAEIGSGDQDTAHPVNSWLVEHEVGIILPPGGEESLAEPGPLDPFQIRTPG